MNPIFLAAWVVVALLALLPVATAQSASRIKVACVGDSITEGSGLANPSVESYPGKLSRLLGPAYEVRNFGVSGRTLLKKGDFPYWNEAAYRNSRNFGPDVVFILLGTNDSKPQNWRHGTNYVADFEELIASYITATSRPRFILGTPPPVYRNGAFDIRPGVVETNIAPLVRDIATRGGHELLDLHTSLGGHSEWFPDTVHPNSRGTTVMAAFVARTISREASPAETPKLGFEIVPNRRVALAWPQSASTFVLQSTPALPAASTSWAIVEQAAFGDGSTVRVTNSISGTARLYRLWRP